MSEADTIREIETPRTRASLTADLRQLGIQPGQTILVHSSLSQIGWVNGGAVAVIQAFQDALTKEGTLVMPAHSGDLSDPAGWQNPPIPQDWHQLVRETMPAFNPDVTPTRGMGKIAELFRTWPDVWRSDHPQLSFAAWGKNAKFVTAAHELTNALGEGSPLARVYDLDGFVLLLGVSYDSNSSFHLAEYRSGEAKPAKQSAPIMRNGIRQWLTYDDIDFNDDLFPQIGAAWEETGAGVTLGNVGSATGRYFRQRAAVDFAVTWLRNQA